MWKGGFGASFINSKSLLGGQREVLTVDSTLRNGGLREAQGYQGGEIRNKGLTCRGGCWEEQTQTDALILCGSTGVGIRRVRESATSTRQPVVLLERNKEGGEEKGAFCATRRFSLRKIELIGDRQQNVLHGCWKEFDLPHLKKKKEKSLLGGCCEGER